MKILIGIILLLSISQAETYQEVKSIHNKKGLKIALPLYIELAKSGDFNSQAILGETYYYGDSGVERNITQGLYWYTKAAEQGTADKLPKLDKFKNLNINFTVADIQYKLAALYKNERGVENQEKGRYWSEQAEQSFLKLAQAGDANAQWKLAVIYRYSRGGRNPLPWLKKAAAQGHRLAIEELKEIESSK